ncbi:MAG: Gfo/Idh/MocA family oxidoreductase [Clostridiales bacterium]|nr:Gfo/Idh/MocA family oxidoreductase [Clostridiales bacterium]
MKVGLIGCGGMGTTHYLSYKALSEKMNVEVTAIADCRQECLDKAAEVWPEATKYHLGMDLIKKAEVDVIDICLPSYLHADHAIAAMEKGCHTFIEKPVCLTKTDCDRLLEAEKKTGVKVMVGQVVRFFGEYKYLKKVYDEQKFGKLKSIVMNRVSGDVTWGYEDWFHDINKSGSVVLDLHIHDLDFLRYMIGEPDEITVNSTTFESGMPNQVITSYKFGDVFANVEGSWDVSSKMPFEAYYRACFEEATIVSSRLHSPHLTVYHKNGTVEHPELTPEYEVENTSSNINIASLGPYYSEIKYFLECIEENKPVGIAPLSEGTKSVLLALLELEQALSK